MQAQFLDKLAFQGVKNGFARFDFTARKFPITVIRLAGRTLAQQHVAIRLHQDADGDVDRFDFHFAHCGNFPAGSFPA
ncbi:hypothetical protein D3C72_1889340 [compost metagenome]